MQQMIEHKEHCTLSHEDMDDSLLSSSGHNEYKHWLPYQNVATICI